MHVKVVECNEWISCIAGQPARESGLLTPQNYLLLDRAPIHHWSLLFPWYTRLLRRQHRTCWSRGCRRLEFCLFGLCVSGSSAAVRLTGGFPNCPASMLKLASSSLPTLSVTAAPTSCVIEWVSESVSALSSACRAVSVLAPMCDCKRHQQ